MAELTRREAMTLRAAIEKAAVSLDDTDALDAVKLFPTWKPDTHYEWNEQPVRVRNPYDGLLYRLVPETHDSQADWPPHLVPAIWVRVDEPDEEWPEWRQPTGAHNAYPANAKVSHNGKHWINTYGDGNNWEPGVFGWSEVTS